MFVKIDKSLDSEKAEKTLISIERSRVSIASKLSKVVSKLLSILNVWQLLCMNSIVLSLISLSLVLYLKMMGELTPFCFYDNWFYIFYYFLLSLFSTVLLPLSNFALFPPDSRFWLWCRRLGAYAVFIEMEGLLYFLVFYNDIAYEVEFDDEAVVLVWSMGSVGVIRFITISIAYSIGNSFLKTFQQNNAIPAKYFGNTFIDWSDISVTELVLLVLYRYPTSLYSLGFVLSVTYLYISFIRF